MASEATSEGGFAERAEPPNSAVRGAGDSSDPAVIHAITQTMIGEFMYKYTRRKLGSGMSENRHKRFFWIHPYTKTLYWSATDPGAQSTTYSNSKSGEYKVSSSSIFRIRRALTISALIDQLTSRECVKFSTQILSHRVSTKVASSSRLEIAK